jgi:hypothetical protein
MRRLIPVSLPLLSVLLVAGVAFAAPHLPELRTAAGRSHAYRRVPIFLRVHQL